MTKLFRFTQPLPPILLGCAGSDERRRQVVKGSFSRHEGGCLPRQVGRAFATQPWEQAGLHNRRFTAARRPDNGDELQLFVARLLQQLFCETVAPEEELFVLFAKGL